MIDLTVKTLDSQNHSFSLDDDITVRGFKEHIAESVAVSADCQRLIYCGRVLQDEKKLIDYDVNGKVIHLVQRAPPQPGQRGNSGGQSQNNDQNNGQNTGRTHRTHYRIIREPQNVHADPNAQVPVNAMYLGAMTLPTEVVEGLPIPPQLSNTLSNSRMVMAKRMLTNANRIMDRLDNPASADTDNSGTDRQQSSSPQDSSDSMDTTRSEPSQGESASQQEESTMRLSTIRRMENAIRMAIQDVIFISRFQNSTGCPEDDTNIHEIEVSTSNDTQPQTAGQQQQQSRENSLNEESRSSERPGVTPVLPRPPQMAELLEMLMVTQDRLRPYLEHYRALMATDPVLSSTGTGPESVAENQHIVDEVSKILHYISHANHALSDIIVDMGQAPPRNLSCRPIIIHPSRILPAGIPIQVEAHISLHGRNTQNNNNSNEENSSASTAPTAPEAGLGTESRDALAEERPQQQNAQQQQTRSDQQQTSDQQERPDQQQQQSQSAFSNLLSSVFNNLPNNLEVLMEVSPDSSMDLNSSDDQSPSNGANANSNAGGNTGRGASGMFPWGAAPPTDFIRNLMHAVAGHIVPDPVGMTNQSQNAANVTISQQTIGVTIDSNGQNSGQSTQARNNVGTHPTTSTQTRSTSRPHVFHSHGVGLGQGLCTDPFLPCNSHHFRRTPTASASASRQSATSRNQAGSQSSASSSTANVTSPNSSSIPWIIDGDRYLDDLRNGLGQRRFRQHRGGLAHSLKNLVRTLSEGKVDVRYSGDVLSNATSITLAEFLENREEGVHFLSTHIFRLEGNFINDLSVLFVQNMTLEGFVSLKCDHYGAISTLRRPLRQFIQDSFPQASSTKALQELFINHLLFLIMANFSDILLSQKDDRNRNIAWVDIVKTIEALFRRHFTDLLQRVFDEDLDDATFGQEVISVLGNMATEVWNVLRYLVIAERAGALVVIQRFVTALSDEIHPFLRHWVPHTFVPFFAMYSTRISQLQNSEILPLLLHKIQTRALVSESSESSDSEAEVVPTVFPGHEMLPPDWVPVIARDGVRQRRLAQGISSGGVSTFSDAYLECLPCKRRKITQQEKPQILVNPTSNHSTITASIERLVRESVNRAGVVEVEGASIDVANDLGVRSAFGQAIRDCLQPQRYRTPDFPDSSRFPNATKFFHQDRPPKQ